MVSRREVRELTTAVLEITSLRPGQDHLQLEALLAAALDSAEANAYASGRYDRGRSEASLATNPEGLIHDELLGEYASGPLGE